MFLSGNQYMLWAKHFFLLKTYFGWYVLTKINWSCHKNVIDFVTRSDFFSNQLSTKPDLMERNGCHFLIQQCKNTLIICRNQDNIQKVTNCCLVLLVFDKNTWTHITASKLFRFDPNARYPITVCKSFLFERDTWWHMHKINLKNNYSRNKDINVQWMRFPSL